MKGILFLDIDNTLVFKDKGGDAVKIIDEEKYIDRETINILKALKKDFVLVLATGRRIKNYVKLHPLIPSDYGIVEHGSIIVHGRNIDEKWARSLENVCGFGKKKGILWDYKKVLESKGVSVESKERFGSIRIDPTDNPGMSYKDVERLIDDRPKELVAFRNEKFVDLLPKEGTKDLAMRYLAKKLGIDWKKSYFVGDDYNDITALKAVAHAYTYAGAVPDAVSAVKARKGYISSRSGHRAIQDILLRIKDDAHDK